MILLHTLLKPCYCIYHYKQQGCLRASAAGGREGYGMLCHIKIVAFLLLEQCQVALALNAILSCIFCLLHELIMMMMIIMKMIMIMSMIMLTMRTMKGPHTLS